MSYIVILLKSIKQTVTSFNNLQPAKQVTALLVVIILLLTLFSAYVSFSFLEYKKEVEVNYKKLNEKILECENLVRINLELERKIIEQESFIMLINAANDYNPNAMWLTDLKGIVKWVNKSYEKKYLLPKNKTFYDLIGTDGTTIFGKTLAELFKDNNKKVFIKDQPITFQEIIPTTKFPVYINRKTIFIGGMEYEIFEE